MGFVYIFDPLWPTSIILYIIYIKIDLSSNMLVAFDVFKEVLFYVTEHC